MNKEQQTIATIKRAVPDIMKRQFGCKVFVKGIREDNPGCEYDIIVDERIKNGKITLGYFGDVPLTEIKIIGRPITLEDVLVASKKPLAVTNYGLLLIKKDISANARYVSSGTSWQPNEPFEKQSKETKELLYNLIVKK